MNKITNLPTGVVGTADTNPHNERSAYKAPKVTTVKFKVEVGLGGSIDQASNWGSDWGVSSATTRKGTEHYFSTDDPNDPDATNQGTHFF